MGAEGIEIGGVDVGGTTASVGGVTGGSAEVGVDGTGSTGTWVGGTVDGVAGTASGGRKLGSEGTVLGGFGLSAVIGGVSSVGGVSAPVGVKRGESPSAGGTVWSAGGMDGSAVGGRRGISFPLGGPATVDGPREESKAC